MSKKTIAMWSIIMVVVFGAMVVIYPMIFNPVNDSTLNPTAEPSLVGTPVGP